MIKEEVKEDKDEFDHDIKSKADNNSPSMEIEIEQEKKEPVLIVNPRSGGGSTGKDWESLFARIKETLGKEPHFVFTEKSRDGTTLATELIEKGYQHIVAVGGDGTINEVVNGFFVKETGYSDSDSSYSSERENSGIITQQKKNRKWKWIKINKDDYDTKFPRSDSMLSINPEAVFSFLPSGTRNVLARSMGMPQDIAASCDNLVKSKPKKIDVLTATVASSEPYTKSSKLVTRVFLNAAEIGVGAEIIDRSKKIRTKIKSRLLSTVASIFVTLPTYESNKSEIFLDGGREKIRSEMTMAVVANGKFLGGGFKAAPRADFSDGLLDVVILKNSGSFKMLDDLVNLKEGDYSTEEDIIYKQAKTVSITSKERNVTVAVEGEPIGILPATFQVIPKALAIRV